MKGGNHRRQRKRGNDSSISKTVSGSSSSCKKITQASNRSADGASAQSGINHVHHRRNEEKPNEATVKPSLLSSNEHIRSRNVEKQKSPPKHIIIKDDEEQEETDQMSKTEVQLDLIRIDHDEEQGNQHYLHPSSPRAEEVALRQQMIPGAVAVRGPEYTSSGQSTTGSIVVGDEHHRNHERTSRRTREGSHSNQDLVVAAEVAPTEEGIERLVHDQVQNALQQTARAEVVPHETQPINEAPRTARTTISKRFCLLIAIFVVIVAVIIGITVSRVLKTDDAEEVCTTDAECSINHADGICNDDGHCLIIQCEENHDDCNRNANDGCEANLQIDNNHCGSCANQCSLVNANSECEGGSCIITSCSENFDNCDGLLNTGCESNLLSNDNHCKACNSKCADDESCLNGACVNVQRFALMRLYESTNGPNWTASAQGKWLQSNTNECDWGGVTCTNGKVEHLSFYQEKLKGTLPTELGLLTELMSIDVRYNDLSGPLPSELGSLTKLTTLLTQPNKISGTVPTDLGRLTNMTYLQISRQKLTGTLPTELASLTKSTKLALGENRLTGTIPTELGRLTNVEILWLHNNQFIGTLPTEIASITKLTELYVFKNDLDSIPSEICERELNILWGDCPPCSCCTQCS